MKTLLLTTLVFFGMLGQVQATVPFRLAKHVDLARSTYASVVSKPLLVTKELSKELNGVFTVRLFAIKSRLLGLDDLKGKELDKFIDVLQKEDSSIGGAFSKNISFLESNDIPSSETLVDAATVFIKGTSRWPHNYLVDYQPDLVASNAGKILEGVDMEGIAYMVSGLSDVFPEFIQNKRFIGKLGEFGDGDRDQWIQAIVRQLDKYPRKEAASEFDERLLRTLYHHPYMNGHRYMKIKE